VTTNNTDTHLNADKTVHMTEWQKTRDSLQFFDDKLHDLRKYGFSFVTALSAAGSILAPIVVSGTSTSVQGHVKLAVFIVTMMLICALYLFDKNYRVLQQAVATRSRVLEKVLNLELSEIITVRYWTDNIRTNVLFVYLLFLFGVAILGGVVLYPNWNLNWWLVGFTILALGFILYQDRQDVKYPNGKEDWIISPLECADNEFIKITVTNMAGDRNPIVFKKGMTIWTIRNEDGQDIFPYTAATEIKVVDSYTWILKPGEHLKSELKPCVCQLIPRGWSRPLHRRIILLGSTSS